MSPDDPTPMFDAHAHIAPDVTKPQLAALGNTHVFAMTRSISEARQVVRRADPGLTWGIGVHPGKPEALTEFDEDTFRRAISHFAIVGEVGLDRRGDRTAQRTVFDSILTVCSDQSVIISIHSTGRATEVLDALQARPHPGAVLHWFTGTPTEIERAVQLGCHFSVNAAMPPEIIAAIPPDRLLTETDFPSSRRKTQASKPGDVRAAEDLIADIHDTNARQLVAANLALLIQTTGAPITLTTP